MLAYVSYLNFAIILVLVAGGVFEPGLLSNLVVFIDMKLYWFII